MNKEDLYPLIGKYLNGYKIVKIEEDPFVKGQINLWTDEWITEYFGDKSIVKFFIRPESNSSRIQKGLIDKEIYQLKDNWNKLKDFISKEYYMYLPLEASTKSIRILIDKMHELEQGNDE